MKSVINQNISSADPKFNLKDKDVVLHGRVFLKALVNAEWKIKDSQISTLQCDNLIVLQMRNWQVVVALMVRKLNAYFLGASDCDFENLNPIFITKHIKE